MAPRWDADRLAAEIGRLGRRGLPRDAFLREAAERLRRAVPADGVCWVTLDPRTLLITGVMADDLVDRGLVTAGQEAGAGAAILRGEQAGIDANPVAHLARRRRPVATLTGATGGRPERSERYRRLLQPAGIPHELRAALVGRGRAWGAVALHRRADAGDFTPREVAAVARVGRSLAEGMRAAVRTHAAVHCDGPRPPGLMVLGPDDEVELVTAPASVLLDGLRPPAGDGSSARPPAAVLGVAARARAGLIDPEGVTVATAAGWVTLHAALPDGGSAGRVAVIVEPARAAAPPAVRLEADGLTGREREVVALVVAGCSTAQIAARLVLSPYTVQDHLKRIFQKTGTRSRRQLVARVVNGDRPSGAAPGPAGGA